MHSMPLLTRALDKISCGWFFFQAGKNKTAARLPEQEEDVPGSKQLWTKCVDQKCREQMGTTVDGAEIRLTIPLNFFEVLIHLRWFFGFQPSSFLWLHN